MHFSVSVFECLKVLKCSIQYSQYYPLLSMLAYLYTDKFNICIIAENFTEKNISKSNFLFSRDNLFLYRKVFLHKS